MKQYCAETCPLRPKNAGRRGLYKTVHGFVKTGAERIIAGEVKSRPAAESVAVLGAGTPVEETCQR